MEEAKKTKVNPLGLTMDDIKPYIGTHGKPSTTTRSGGYGGKITDLALEIIGDIDENIKCIVFSDGYEWDYPMRDFIKDDLLVNSRGEFQIIDCDDWARIKDYDKVREDIARVVAVEGILCDPCLFLTHHAIDIFCIRNGRDDGLKYIKVTDEQWNRLKAFKTPVAWSKTYRQYVHDPWVTTSVEAIVWEQKWANREIVFHRDEPKREYSYPMDYWD